MTFIFLFTVRNQSLLCWLGTERGSGFSFSDVENQRDIRYPDSQPFLLRKGRERFLTPPRRSSWICTEENGCPAWPSWCCWQDPHAVCTSSLVLAAQLRGPLFLKWISAVQEACWGSVPCFCGPKSPLYLWGHQVLTRRRLTYKKALKAIVDFSGLVPALMPRLALPLPHTQPDLFTWYWIYGRADCHLQQPPRWKPVSLLTVPSCKLHF